MTAAKAKKLRNGDEVRIKKSGQVATVVSVIMTGKVVELEVLRNRKELVKVTHTEIR